MISFHKFHISFYSFYSCWSGSGTGIESESSESPGFGWFHQWGNPYLPRGWLENPPNWTSMTRSGVFLPPLKQSEGNSNISNCWLHSLHISIYSYDLPNKSPFTTYYSHEKFSEKMPAIFIPLFETEYSPIYHITIPVGFWFRSHQIPFFINAYCIPIINAFFYIAS